MLDLLDSPEPMLETIYREMARHGLPLDLVCDHLCYRVATNERYEELREKLKSYGRLVGEVDIGGRWISTYALHQPYLYQDRSIEAIELPAPKAGSIYKEGWEHAEFVTDTSLTTLAERYPHLSFNASSLNKPHNPELGLRLTPDFQIKFHNSTLLSVVQAELSDPHVIRRTN